MLSIILLSYYSGDRIHSVYQDLSGIMAGEGIPFEFIVIDDGSADDSFQQALALEEKYDNVRAYQLARNYTSQYAIFAGFSVCNGDVAVMIPDDGQQPYETLVQMYRIWESGAKLIVPYRIKRNDGMISDFFSRSYYLIMNAISMVKFPPGGCDVFMADREIINILNKQIHPINTSATVEVLRIGFDPVFLPFERPKVNTPSRWTFRKKWRLFKETLFSSSNFPIKFVTMLGLSSFLFSIFLIVLSIILKLMGAYKLMGFSLPGWTSILIISSLFSGLTLFGLGIISEYIWLIYEEVKARPGFIIKDK